MKVIIHNANSWYRYALGKEFDVIDKENRYYVTEEIRYKYGFYIDKSDAYPVRTWSCGIHTSMMFKAKYYSKA